MSNIIVAIKNLVSDPQLELGNYYNSRHRANAEGDSLEEYIKDLYSGTLREANEEERARKIRSVFSYIGNDSNPPDAMLFGEDAIEVKMEMSRNVQSGNTQNLKSTVIQRSFPKWSVAERRKTAAASDQAAVCACAHSRYFTGGSPSGLRV